MKRRPARAGTYHRRSAPTEIHRKTRADGKTIIEGYASVFGSKNSFDEIFVPGAFQRSIDESSEGKGPTIVHLLHHDERQALGVPRLREDDNGLHFETVPLATDVARSAIIEIEAGALSGVSVGFSYRKGGTEWIDADGDKPEHLKVTAARLFELSSVRWGSDPEALGGIAQRSRFARRLAREECTCQKLDEEPTEDRGASLSALLNGALDELVDEETSREDLIEQHAEEQGVESASIAAIIDGDVDCPPMDALESLGAFLGLSMELIQEALEADGCSEDEEIEVEDDEEVEVEDEERSVIYQLVRRRYDPSTPAKVRAALDVLLLEMTTAGLKPSTKKRSKTKINPVLEALKNFSL